MSSLPVNESLAWALCRLLAPEAPAPPSVEVVREQLPSSREVYRFTFNGNGRAAVGKFFTAYPPVIPLDQGLAQEYDNYLRAAALGLTQGCLRIPRLLGRRPELCLGLLLEAIPGPDLDSLLQNACRHGELAALYRGLVSLAELLAFFHSRPVPEAPVSGLEALGYLDKLRLQLHGLGLLTPADETALAAERAAWEGRLAQFPDRQVLVHGDATPTNFLFPRPWRAGRPAPPGRGPGPGAPAAGRPPFRPLLGGRRTEARLGLAHRPGRRGRRRHRPLLRRLSNGPARRPRSGDAPGSPQPLLHGPGGVAHRPQRLSFLGLPPLAGGRGPAVSELRQKAVKIVSSFEFLVFS